MANAAILYDNLADAATVSASSWIASAPPTMLQNPHVRRRWKGRNGASEYILCDFGSEVSIDTVALFGCQGVLSDVQRNLSSAATTRIRLSNSDDTGVTGEIHDSGSAAGRISDAYGALVYLLDAPVSARYLRIDLGQSSADALLAGRLVAGVRHTFSINFNFDWQFGYADLSRKSRSAGGQTFIERDDRYRIVTLTFGFLSEADRYSAVDDIDRLKGVSSDILLITDPDSARLDRDSVWGLLQDLSPVTQPFFDNYSKTYALEERL